jgi:hypothetical protein
MCTLKSVPKVPVRLSEPPDASGGEIANQMTLPRSGEVAKKLK